jgi:hypothetical protein
LSSSSGDRQQDVPEAPCRAHLKGNVFWRHHQTFSQLFLVNLNFLTLVLIKVNPQKKSKKSLVVSNILVTFDLGQKPRLALRREPQHVLIKC